MNINNLGQSFTKISVLNGQILPHLQTSNSKNKNHHPIIEPKPPVDNHILPIKPNPATSVNDSRPSRIDLSNMTPIEFDQLMHSELVKEQSQSSGSLDVIPYWNNRFDSVFQDIVRVTEKPDDQKMDILGVIQKAIEVKTNNNQSVELLEQNLEKLRLLDGQTIPYSIDFSA